MKKVSVFIFLFLFLATNHVFAFQIFFPDEGQKIKLKLNTPLSLLVENAYNDAIAVKIDIEKDTIRELPVGTPDCSGSVKAFPKLIMLQPKEKQAIKFIARGTGKCRVFFTIDREKPDKVQVSDGAVISIRYRIGVPVDVE